MSPAGWLAHGWTQLLAGQPTGWLLLAGLSTAAVLGANRCALALRQHFQPEATFGYDDVDPTSAAPKSVTSSPADASATDTATASSSDRGEMDAETLDEARGVALAAWRVAAAAPLGQSLGRAGTLEDRALRLFTRRERVVLDFLRPAGVPWVRGGMIACALLALAALVRLWVPGFSALIALMGVAAVLPLMGGRWIGFGVATAEHMQIGLHALSPVGYWEIARVILKVNAVRCLLALPVVVPGAWLILQSLPSYASAPALWDATTRALLVVLAAQPLWIVINISKTTNDSSAGRWRRLPLMLFVLGGLVTFVTLGVVGFMAETPEVALGCLGTFAVLAHLLLALYGWAFNRGLFDLLGKRSQS